MKKFLGLNEYEAEFLIDLLSKSQYENESDNTDVLGMILVHFDFN